MATEATSIFDRLQGTAEAVGSLAKSINNNVKHDRLRIAREELDRLYNLNVSLRRLEAQASKRVQDLIDTYPEQAT